MNEDPAVRESLGPGECRALSAPGKRAAAVLESLYTDLNRREYIEPDPLQFVLGCESVRDREIVAMVASSLAYGRVRQILLSVGRVLKAMAPSPFGFVTGSSPREIAAALAGFRHRFTSGSDMAGLVAGMRRLILAHGSLNNCFLGHCGEADRDVLPALDRFVRELDCRAGGLVPAPSSGSACKRLHLFLRWMVREDGVDPGGWTGVSPALLVVPLDTHMAGMARRFGWSRRKSADGRMAAEVTEWFRKVNPGDPVKYDFALTRFGIRRGLPGPGPARRAVRAPAGAHE